ncbi:PRC-barrel domain-containing protein [Agrococcus citreus]|uniref:PRC-barrel domain-containing protein n=1 Tax=Agrococcus citreus TaxID=84643 RepID=A0ABP4JKR9_9MICO
MTFQGNIDALPGREVFGSDGRRIGKVGQVFVLEGTDDPTWMTVHTGLFGTHESFVPVSEATERGAEVHVPFEKSFVQDAPRIDDATELTVEHEAELYRYYGVQPPMAHGAAGAGVGAGAGAGAAAGAAAGAGMRADQDGRGSHDDRDARDGRDVLDRDAQAQGTDAHDERRHSSAGDRRDGGSDDSEGVAGTGAGAPRLRRRVVTEMQTIQVPVQREEIVVDDDGRDDADIGRNGR